MPTLDYDADPDRYRRGMSSARSHARVSLYDTVAGLLGDAARVLDVGCAEGVLRAALPVGVTVVGLDSSPTMLRAHPPPVVRADAAQLPFRDASFDAVTALNVLYHLPDPRPALCAARRVLRPGGMFVTSAIARDDSPELAEFWARPRTSFDAEDAPQLVIEVFGQVEVRCWDAPLVTLPDRVAVRDYLTGRQAPVDVAERAAAAVSVPLAVTKRGALLTATHA